MMTAPSHARRGYIDLAGLPAAGSAMDYPTELRPNVRVGDTRVDHERRPAPAHAAPAGPIITVTITLSTNLLDPQRWAQAVDSVRRVLDMSSSHRIEAFSCGADPVRHALWHADIRPRYINGVREDLERLAQLLRGGARLSWAPCSAIEL